MIHSHLPPKKILPTSQLKKQTGQKRNGRKFNNNKIHELINNTTLTQKKSSANWSFLSEFGQLAFHCEVKKVKNTKKADKRHHHHHLVLPDVTETRVVSAWWCWVMMSGWWWWWWVIKNAGRVFWYIFWLKNVFFIYNGIQSRKVSHVSFCSDLFFLVVRCDFLKITLLPTWFFVNVISIAWTWVNKYNVWMNDTWTLQQHFWLSTCLAAISSPGTRILFESSVTRIGGMFISTIFHVILIGKFLDPFNIV